jgi:MFS family permease
VYRYRHQRLSHNRAAYAGFAAFGAFWGTWGASVPAVRDQSGLGEGELGTALLFIGAGALPAMPLAGRAMDRWGTRVAAMLLVLLGAAGVALAVTARDFVSVSVGLALLGAASGGADVAINATAGSAERETGLPVITRAHGVFSAAVVMSSLSTGLLRKGGAPVAIPFLLVAAAAGLAAIAILAAADGARAAPRADRAARPPLSMLPLLVGGALGALAYAVENAHQSWSAVYFADVLAANPAIAAAGPAVFAAVAAVTRFVVGVLRAAHATVVVAGAATAAAGSALMAAATTVPVALAGLALAAAGTAVLFPTLLAVVTAGVDDSARGAATSVVTAVAYLGFLAGPAYVGAWAAATGLPGAMLAVAGLAAGLALLAGPSLTATRRRARARSDRTRTALEPTNGAPGRRNCR